MGLKEDLISDVTDLLKNEWKSEDASVIPEPEAVALGNHGKRLARATVLYADLSGSTTMVDTKKWWFCAEVYKTYLGCAAKLIRSHNGQITAYDGDRIMAVFIGEMQCTTAAKCALQINGAVIDIINPAIKTQYPNNSFEVRHVVGIDTTEIHVARIGVRGDNDLVWIGRAANYAAKLTELDASYPTYITAEVHNKLADSSKMTKGVSMWEKRLWPAMSDMEIYRSNWHWPL